MGRISKYTAATVPAGADITVIVQGGVTKKVSLTTLATYFGTFIKHNFAGTTTPGTGDDSADGYSVGSIWINLSATPKEAYQCVDATVGAASWINTTLTISELGTAALLDIEAATAQNDIIVGSSSPVKWVKKTLAEFLAIIGMASKADKVATSPAPAGYVAEFDSGGNIAKSTKLASDIHALDTDNQNLSGLVSKVPASPAPAGYVAELDSGGSIIKSSKLVSDIHALGADDQSLSGLATKVPTSPVPTGKVAEFDSAGNLAVSTVEVEDIVLSADIRTIVKCTQAEYGALSPPDPDTLYIIVEA